MSWAPAVQIVTDGGVACGVTAWRHQRRRMVTVVVKASFTLVHGGPIAESAAVDIVREDRFFSQDPARSVEAASEVAPFLGRCDVLFRGHAYAQKGQPAPAGTARLALFRDARPLLDKTLHVYGDADPASASAIGARRGPFPGARRPFARMPIVYERAFGGPEVALNPVGSAASNLVDPADPRRPVGLGPIARRWPARRRLLEGHDLLGRDGLIELPDAAGWDGYQAAPADQQVGYLRGGEWLVLDGLHPTLPRLQTQIPAVRGAARAYLRGTALPVETPLELVADMLVIDGDTGLCALVWRGRYELPDERAPLSAVAITAGLERQERLVPWTSLAARAAAALAEGAVSAASAASAAGPASVASGPRSSRHETVTLVVDEQAASVRPAVIPFAGAPSTAPPSAPRNDATPWGGAPLRPAASAPQPVAVTVALSISELSAPPSNEVTVTPSAPATSRAEAPAEEDEGAGPRASVSSRAWITPPPMIGPIVVPQPAAEAPPVTPSPVDPPPAPARPVDLAALTKKAGKGRVGAEDAEAFRLAFVLPPPNKQG